MLQLQLIINTWKLFQVKYKSKITSNKEIAVDTKIPTIGIPRRDKEANIFGAFPFCAKLCKIRDVLYKLLLYTESAATITNEV